MMSDSAGGDTPDADPVRTLVLGLLERVEQFAATVISDRDPREGGSADLGPAIRATVDTVITEIGEFATNIIAAIIAVLEAISAALDEAMGARGRSAPGHPTRPATGFQPIAVEVEMGEPQW
ncbi:hypothetical protein GCM10007298_26520 [Williamsia phyllosphaerae]|uniref:Uncharacterized protein n=2 Tax=Williamsia phyllosphaerae TaxID=885042 RepID=A0ABQ1UYE7_9NOCA|nr:hypothetical protein GCM10007298_26520 [Williamsia phyllosphaerae]